MIAKKDFSEPDIEISSDMQALSDCELVVLCAGVWASQEQKDEFKKIDPSGRLVQSYTNFSLVKNLSESIKHYVPEAHIVVVTNQSDLMAELVRETVEPKKVLGMGGMVDSARFRTLLAKNTGAGKTILAKGNHMIGYHNSDMIPLQDSVSCFANIPNLEAIVKETKAYGENISKLQRDFNFPTINSGASILPGAAIALTIAAFTGKISDLEEAFNVRLSNEEAKIYGVRSETALSVPVKISKGGYEVATRYAVLESEKKHLLHVQEKFRSSYNNLLSLSDGDLSITKPQSPINRL